MDGSLSSVNFKLELFLLTIPATVRTNAARPVHPRTAPGSDFTAATARGLVPASAILLEHHYGRRSPYCQGIIAQAIFKKIRNFLN
jgi:hypothetical protein